MEDIFRKIGAEVEVRWRALGKSPKEFTYVAYGILQQAQLHRQLNLQALLLLCSDDSLPFQSDLEARFGQPPVTVYLSDTFRIEILFWLEGSPSVHQHAFSGAFQVLLGDSLHAEWGYQNREVLDVGLDGGLLALKSAELLRAGDIRPIRAGKDFIHSTFHLRRPTISIVVRTIYEQDYLPQFGYLYPTLRYDSTARTHSSVRVAQLINMLLECGEIGLADELADSVILRRGLADIVFAIIDVSPRVTAQVHRRLIAGIASRTGESERFLRPALEEHSRKIQLQRLRRLPMSEDLSFALAVMQNIPTRQVMLTLLDITPEDAPKRLGDLALALAEHINLDSATVSVLAEMVKAQVQPQQNMSPEVGVMDGERREKANQIRDHWLFGLLMADSSSSQPEGQR